MKNKKTLHKLEKELNELNYAVRYEKGNFSSGYCIVQDKRVVIVNKFFSMESKVDALTEILTEIIRLSNLSAP